MLTSKKKCCLGKGIERGPIANTSTYLIVENSRKLCDCPVWSGQQPKRRKVTRQCSPVIATWREPSHCLSCFLYNTWYMFQNEEQRQHGWNNIACLQVLSCVFWIENPMVLAYVLALSQWFAASFEFQQRTSCFWGDWVGGLVARGPLSASLHLCTWQYPPTCSKKMEISVSCGNSSWVRVANCSRQLLKVHFLQF